MKHPFEWWRECVNESLSRRINPETFEQFETNKSRAYSALLDIAYVSGYLDAPGEILAIVKVARDGGESSPLIDEFEVTGLREQNYVLEYEKNFTKE